RVLDVDDNQTLNNHPVAVLSHGYWKERFAGSDDVLGAVLRINGARFTVVGVAQPGFRGVFLESPTDVWIPAMMQADIRYHQNFSASDSNAEAPWIPQAGISWLDILVRAKRDAAPGILTALNGTFQQRLNELAESLVSSEKEVFLDRRLVYQP